MFNRKKSAKTPKAAKEPRLKAIREYYGVTKSVKPWIVMALLATFLFIWVIGILLGYIWDNPASAVFVALSL